MTKGCHVALFRHGRTRLNEQGIVIGQLDPPLTDAGQAEARDARRKVSGVDVFISSDLERARTTLSLLAPHGAQVLLLTTLLRERDFGDLAGKPKAEAIGFFQGDRTKTPPGGESFSDFVERVDRAILLLAALHSSLRAERLALVAHSGVLRVVLARSRGDNPWKNALEPINHGFVGEVRFVFPRSG